MRQKRLGRMEIYDGDRQKYGASVLDGEEEPSNGRSQLNADGRLLGGDGSDNAVGAVVRLTSQSQDDNEAAASAPLNHFDNSSNLSAPSLRRRRRRQQASTVIVSTATSIPTACYRSRRPTRTAGRKVRFHLQLVTVIVAVLLTQLTVNISIGKPKDINVFLEPFVTELNKVLEQGIKIKDTVIKLNLRCIICDTPARAMLRGEAASQILNKAEPLFITRSEAFKFAVGDTITLPCEVSSPGSYVLAWKRGIAILTAGTVKVTPDPRVRLVNGYTLQILDAAAQDAGDYICQIATMNPREITHHVEILVPPKITHVTSGGHLQVRKGSPVRLECSATGNPMPNITWTRKNNLLPNGEEQFTSSVYVIENMDRHKGGTYICTANNGVGQVATSQIILHVLYPPEISVENPIVYSGEGQEAMLVCIVHGESQPEVLWHKDTMQIDQTERHVIESRGARHTLIIRKVHPQDFGNYSCIADNQLGKTRKTVTLTGKPKAAVFRSMPNSQWKDRYNISWIVDSHSPIEEYKLYYRLVDGDLLQNHDGVYMDNRKTHHTYMGGNMLEYDRKITSFDAYSYNNAYGGGHNLHHKWSKTDWRDVVLPAFPYSHHYTQGMSYLLRGLEPDQQYEARVQSRNRYGWSDFSESFLFTTSNTDTEIRDLSVTHRGSSSGSSIYSHRIPSACLALVLVAAGLFRLSF